MHDVHVNKLIVVNFNMTNYLIDQKKTVKDLRLKKNLLHRRCHMIKGRNAPSYTGPWPPPIPI